jgi:hypothetical protein
MQPMSRPESLRPTRPQVTLSEAVQDYLELKSELTGRPVSTLISDLVFESMKSELSELVALKAQLAQVKQL